MRQKKEKKKKERNNAVIVDEYDATRGKKMFKISFNTHRWRLVGSSSFKATIFQHFVTLLSHRFGDLFIIVTRLKKKNGEKLNVFKYKIYIFSGIRNENVQHIVMLFNLFNLFH